MRENLSVMKRKMKTLKTTLLLMVAIGSAGILVTGCKQEQRSTSTEKPLYTCGMHPQVVQDHPGNCPICGMKLTPIHKQGGGSTNDSSLIAVDPVTTQNMGIRTQVVQRGPLRRKIRSSGRLITTRWR